jgi:ketosteroid isomerase-like protein
MTLEEMTVAGLRPDAAASTRNVFEHHLAAFAQGLDAVLSDYDENAVLVTPDATYRGMTEIRGFFKAFLDSATPAFWAAFEVRAQSVEGEVAYLVWASLPAVQLATDTLLVRGNKIQVQTFTPLNG